MVEVDGDLWIVDFGWSQITRYDLASDTVVATTAVSSPTDVIFAEGTIWVPNHYGRAEEAEPITAGAGVVRIDPATNKVAATIKVGPRPYYMAAGFGAAWTGTATGGSVERIDAATNEVTTIWIGEDGAFDIEVVGDSVWVVVGPQWPVERACDPETSFFVRIDPKTNATRERVAFPCPGSITPAGNGFWVSGQGSDGPISTFFEPIG
jgi:DNA-binding beta-propeller fold protein YncE